MQLLHNASSVLLVVTVLLDLGKLMKDQSIKVHDSVYIVFTLQTAQGRGAGKHCRIQAIIQPYMLLNTFSVSKQQPICPELWSIRLVFY